ncbi:hypothetical protein CALVIDRAFT_540055 [Calocera viscosa TUFC12733]|uniref:Uncharacterized protein n=1 Tax=Calocera viscosa (strain TUFC12733) TaxID=1330018 RepID=A0A167J7Z5_CALVF|nr:hypothetical protein CALVIDRAFT_540055 [Calocera viscosa TUFC12733]
MSFGDVSSTELESLFADMEISPFSASISRSFRWVASGLSTMAKVEYNMIHTMRRSVSHSSLKSTSPSSSIPVIVGTSTQREQ